MSPDVLLLALIAAPVLIFMLLRVNASLVFLSACLGAVLLQYVGGDANDFFTMFVPSVSPEDLKLGLVLLPVVLTTVFMIKTVKGARLAFNLLPALGTSLLLTLLIMPLLSGSITHNITASSTWHQVQALQALIVGVSALLCLFSLWLQRPKHHADGKHAKHHS